MAEDKDKRQYSYRPNIEYQDTYESDYNNSQYDTVDADNTISEDESIEITNSITNTFNELSKLIPMLPAELQTAINNVYRPILDNWTELKDKPYPKKIPDPDEPIWESNREPDPIEPWDPSKKIPPFPPDYPEPGDSISDDNDYYIDNDGIWDIDYPIRVIFPKYDPIKIIEKEFIKNVADLFKYYVNRLKDILYHYYSEKVAAVFGKKRNAQGNLISKTMNEVSFILDPIEDSCGDVENGLKHLFDAGLAMGETTMLKLHFLANVFPFDQTLLHLKNFKAVYLLRLRYASIDAVDGSNKVDAMSNNILKGMKISYNQKYDVAFMNLYRYLDSSLDILEDVINTELAGIRAKRTLIEKGGINK